MGAAGFSLLEILIAFVILAMVFTGVMTMFTGAQTETLRAELLTTATMLARQRMGEVMLDMDRRIAEGRFPEDDEHEEDAFAAPFDRFRWRVDIRKVELPLPPTQEENAGLMQMFMQTIAKQIAEAVREIKLTISWQVRGRDRIMVVTTHVVNI
ncbi:MAG: type II secretion system protein [Deltaproteobacteria bacterium]|nr:type II secretion system protein [Deltaproteobacteria bacterium]